MPATSSPVHFVFSRECHQIDQDDWPRPRFTAQRSVPSHRSLVAGCAHVHRWRACAGRCGTEAAGPEGPGTGPGGPGTGPWDPGTEVATRPETAKAFQECQGSNNNRLSHVSWFAGLAQLLKHLDHTAISHYCGRTQDSLDLGNLAEAESNYRKVNHFKT